MEKKCLVKVCHLIASDIAQPVKKNRWIVEIKIKPSWAAAYQFVKVVLKCW